ncbi:hypothetical protein BC939DRAFT_510101 [Gamsiella multidivaricata]|uniref:uncharacterized protein n=1 Tax=Gamsiella multidivaricata TaxID=101098 RepID=UPI00221F0F83|nr:uncharacterized protein BC939DRAFT_510101 [Gamsiella multidivaricata]KAG0364186.1 hypothetical protein BGZ54_007763 [Gamsiella multidivaricata]KAI7829327.1 hypothetical protein BC939DRAFT_510101 [Gamsiella multidivaricata]
MEHSYQDTCRGDSIAAIIPTEEADPLLRKSASDGSSSIETRRATQRSLGFKNVVIYVLIFLNLVLLTKLCSTYSHQQQNYRIFALDEKEPDRGHEHGGEDATSISFWLKMGLIVLLVMIGGIFAGLTIGLMGLDETNLHVLMASGSPEEQVHAETVFTLLSRGKHWVLVTLLLGNVIVNETLPVVLDSELGGGVVAILISTMLIVIFGEIIPQAVCARYGLAIGSYCAKPMIIVMYIMSPIAYPIALLLDAWLGVHHGTTYRRTELKTLVSLHQVDGIGELTDDEVTIIASVLDLKGKSVSQIMTPLEDVFTLSEDAILDEELMEEIVSAGYSRIPIYRHDDPSNFIGMLLVKRLITYDPEDHIAVRHFTINSLPEAAPDTSCLDILNFFQEGRSHMAMVTSEPGGLGVPVGVITLEDVIEELLGEEIVDESDVYVDVHNKIKVIRKPVRTSNMIKNLKTLLRSPAISNAATPLLGPSGTFVANTQGASAAGTPRLGECRVPMPAENQSYYMATGKTILQSRTTSFVGAAGETRPLLDVNAGRHECEFRTGSFSKGDHSSSIGRHHEPQQEQVRQRPRPMEEASGVYFKEQLGQGARSAAMSPLLPLAEAAQIESPAISVRSTGASSETTTANATTEPTTPASSAMGTPSVKRATVYSGLGLDGIDTSAVPPKLADGVPSPAPSTGSSKKKKKKKRSNM